MHDYFILTADDPPEHCVIDDLPRPLRKKGWRATQGVRMGEIYPAGVRLDMSYRFDGIVVPDYIPNTVLKPMVSGRLKALLEQHSGAEIEFLPFTLYNHLGRVAAQDCFIANVIGTRDCADMSKTRGEKSIMDPGTLEALFRLHLDPAKVLPEDKLFRLSIMPRFLIIRDDLHAILDAHDMKGLRYIAMGEKCRLV